MVLVKNMIKKINNLNIHYIDYGKEEKGVLVFLHGWGQNIAMMRPLADKFSKEYRIIILDLPGFGESEIPDRVLTLQDYVSIIHTLLKEEKVKNPILIGHSFGGKLTLLYASQYNVDRIVLLASPYKKHVKKETMKMKTLKFLKKVPVINKLEGFAKKHMGSTDYRNASPIMREILVGHVNTDLTEDVKKISCPCLFIWGDCDTEVPLEEAYELEKLVSDGGVVVLEGGTHYAYLEFLGRVISILRSFFR